MVTNDQRARKLKKKVEAAPVGFSSAGAALTLVEAFYERIVQQACVALRVKDLGLDAGDPSYAREVGTLDGLVWGYCFAWDNAYEPYFTEARTRLRRQAIKEARKRMNDATIS